jgi:hypothetical protein
MAIEAGPPLEVARTILIGFGQVKNRHFFNNDLRSCQNLRLRRAILMPAAVSAGALERRRSGTSATAARVVYCLFSRAWKLPPRRRITYPHRLLEEMTMPRNERNAVVAGLAVTVAICALPALAEGAPPDSENGRYTFNKVQDGYLRLDAQTGQVSVCSHRSVGWACQAVPEDRAVLENEIARLRSENAALKKDILSRGLPLPAGTMPDPPIVRNGDHGLRLPNNDDIGRMMAFVGRMWRRLVEFIENVQKDVLRKS